MGKTTMTEQKTVAYIVRKMPEEMRQNLKIKAAMNNVSMQDLLLQIIGEYLEK